MKYSNSYGLMVHFLKKLNTKSQERSSRFHRVSSYENMRGALRFSLVADSWKCII